ncbi:hypothetical protein EYC80_003547 [Monilinia laxa]|uniref:Uncharacterized protein n=1 Tax=Monilinia laxa TaxID=61186 RepID=A0A5N6KKB4_MONLA|nr:hypothetical protein EYC80_003547 [Monilinia laxa]
MPPKKATPSTPTPATTTTQVQPQPPTDITLLFKHTSHTILLLTTAHQTFAQILTHLLTVLRERYPNGLLPIASPPTTTTTSPTSPPPETQRIPLPSTIQDIALALPRDAQDPKKGWTELDLGLGDTPGGLGLRDGAVLAFKFLGDDEETERGFDVRWPSYEEMYGDVEEEEGDEDVEGGGEDAEDEEEEDL